MVRKITLDFLFKEKGIKLVVDTEEAFLAMAFILADSKFCPECGKSLK
jgi:hypothetical protein